MDIKYTTCSVEDIQDVDIAAFLGKGPVFFVGSHISSYSPTNLPTGQSFGWALYHYIFQEMAEDELLAELYNDIPFEALMEACPDPDQALKVLSAAFLNDNFNPAHSFLARQLYEKKISAMITPDYDMTLDAGLKKHGIKAVVRMENIPENIAERVYFKIHGSADQPESMIFTLKREGELDNWKYKLLTALTTGKVVVFVGYSARDFDICPMIAFEKVYDRIIWLHYGDPESLSPYAMHLLNSGPNNVLVTGDFCKFLSKFFNETVNAEKGNGSFEPQTFGLSDGQLLIWRLNLLDRLAYAKLGLPLLGHARTFLTFLLYKNLEGAFYAHQGHYLSTAKICAELVEDSRLSPADRVQQLMSAAGTYSAYGNYFLSLWYSNKMKDMLYRMDKEGQLDDLSLRLRLTFLMTRNQYCQRLGFETLSRSIVAEAQQIYEKLYFKLIHDGNWNERQIVQHMAERLKLKMPDRPLALTADVGFRNLGLPGMDIISVKDLIRNGDAEQRKSGLKRLDDTIRIAKGIGMFTETWKHNRLKILNVEMSRDERNQCFQEWWANLSRCEYFFLTLRPLFWIDYLIIRIRFLTKA